MTIFLSSLNSIIPLLIVIAIGYIIGRLFHITDDFSRTLSSITFKILMPFHLFCSIYNNTSFMKINFMFFLIIIAIQLLSFGICILIANRLSSQKERSGVLFQAFFRSNIVVFGLSIAQALLDSSGVALYTLSLLLVLPCQNFGTIVGLELYQTEHDKTKQLSEILIKSFFNPNTIGMLFAVIMIILHISLPTFIYKGISDVAKIASPLSLILIGTGFDFSGLLKDIRALTIAAVVKLILLPLLFSPLIILFHLNFTESITIILLLASPTATAIYAPIEESGMDKKYAKETIIYTQLISIVTLTIWVYIIQLITL